MQTGPYDEALDVYLRGRGWWSRRTYCEHYPERDFMYERWTWGTGKDGGDAVTLVCLDPGVFEADWKRFPDFRNHERVRERYESRAAVIARVPALETVRMFQPAQYE